MHPRTYQFFEELTAIHHNNNDSLSEKVRKQRTCLEDVCKALSRDDGVVFSNLQGRMDYVCNKKQVSDEVKGRLHHFRIRVNKIIHENEPLEMPEYYSFLKTLARGFAELFDARVPPEVAQLYKNVDFAQPKKNKASKNADDLRGIVQEVDRENKRFQLLPEDDSSGDLVTVKYDVNGKNRELTPSMELLNEGDVVQVLDIFKDEDECLIPDIIVVQPDYLVDVTAVAGCFLNIYGTPVKAFELFFTGRAQKRELTTAIHKGNIANLIFDEVVNESPSQKTTFDEVLKKSFQEYPLAYTAIKGKPKSDQLLGDLKTQYNNIRETVDNAFRKGEHQPIDRDRSNLEVFLISHELGLQGRMDLFDDTPSANGHYHAKILELKSGGGSFIMNNPVRVDESHGTQVRMYNMLTSRVLGHHPQKIFQAVLYSAVSKPGEAIRSVNYRKHLQREIINVRNQIVSWEFRLAQDDASFAAGKALVGGIDPGKYGLDGNAPDWVIEKFLSYPEMLQKASPLEQQYYFAFSSFIAREKLLSKVGDGEYTKGLSALWNKEDLADEDTFNHLKGLVIQDNRASQPEAVIVMKRPAGSNRFVNFRRGDICVLYPDVPDRPLAVQHRVLKCTIEHISNEEVGLKLRQQQNSSNYFEDYEQWTVEHDSLDNNFEQMHRGLFEFLNFDKAKKDLLLGLQAPREYAFAEKTFVEENNSSSPADSIGEQNEILSKAWLTKDYFLLVGPPGTGKTNNFLHRLVRHLVQETGLNILLVSYTNRAVDEMCGSVRGVVNDAIIRIGSSLGCDPEHEDLMLDEKIGHLNSREEIRNLIQETRVYTGTLSSILGRNELFDLKKFDIAIVDEASQILEPNIINLLGRVDKFVLIGDERQLPAVVTQPVSQSALEHRELNDIGLYDRRNSYFERLLYLCKKNNWHHAWGELTFQGRMHPEIAAFPNQCFYQNKLKEAGLAHQFDALHEDGKSKDDLEAFLARHRMVYIPSEPMIQSASEKSNQQEAEVVSKVLQSLVHIHQLKDDEIVEKIGVITPYRNQIACIRQQLEKDGIDCFESIQVDTVERFQGSQKDFILISLCVNSPRQMDLMASARVTMDEQDGFVSSVIDRKLNVTLTRARKQIVITGEEGVLTSDLTYGKLVDFIKTRGGYIEEGARHVLNGTFVLPKETDGPADRDAERVPETFSSAWQSIIATPVFDHPGTSGPVIMGHSADINLNIGTEYGRTNFDKSSGKFLNEGRETSIPAVDKVLLYGHFHLRNNYMAVLNLAGRFSKQLISRAKSAGGRVTIIDFGAGPGTAGMAVTDALDRQLDVGSFNYIGIDPSENMRQMASAFLEHDAYRRRPYYKLVNSPEAVTDKMLSGIFERPNFVIFTFAFILEQIDASEIGRFSQLMHDIRANHPENNYAVLVASSPATQKSYNIRQLRSSIRAGEPTDDPIYAFSYPAKKDGSKYKKGRYFGEFFGG